MSKKQELIDHMDRDALAFGLPKYSELEERLRWALSFIDTYARHLAGPATPEVNKVRATLGRLHM